MAIVRLKRIGLAICLMASLVSASPAACLCSHHEDTKAPETDCHSQHEAVKQAETSTSGDVLEESCVCAVAQRMPVLTSKSGGKERKPSEDVSFPIQLVQPAEFVVVDISRSCSPDLARSALYSGTINPLLPSRAPPRL